MSFKLVKIFLSLIISTNLIKAQISSIENDPTILSWIKSTGFGYSGILTNIDKVEYSSNYVSIHSSGIPSYSTGPWSNSSEIPLAQNVTFKLSRNIGKQNSAATKKKAAQKVGILVNGVSIYNSNDGQSYLNLGNNTINSIIIIKKYFTCNYLYQRIMGKKC
jgi:hypothetical protein